MRRQKKSERFELRCGTAERTAVTLLGGIGRQRAARALRLLARAAAVDRGLWGEALADSLDSEADNDGNDE